jgi:hypothetical protein
VPRFNSRSSSFQSDRLHGRDYSTYNSNGRRY